jgi:transposase
VVVAAKILGHVGDIRRFPSQDHFASYTATAPLDASSGNQQRHRLTTGGNRQLNATLHLIAVCQARDPGPGRRYYLRKLSEGKTQPRPVERSSDAWPTSSTGASWPTNADTNQSPLDAMKERGLRSR